MEVAPEVQPIEVPVRVHIDWTQERIEQEIRTVFPDAPIMVKVAHCEGKVNGKLDPDAFNPTNSSNDRGIFQISELYHQDRYESLGLDMHDVQDNIAFARILYDDSGLAPWIWSKPCWSK